MNLFVVTRFIGSRPREPGIPKQTVSIRLRRTASENVDRSISGTLGMRVALNDNLHEGTQTMRRSVSLKRTLLLVCSVIIVWSAVETGCAQENEYRSPERFEKAIQAFEQQDRTRFPPANAIVCVGSSSMKKWHENIREDLAPLTIIPRGFGGSNMNDALVFADRVVLAYKPRAVVVYEGDNDIAQGISPEKVRDTFLAFVRKIHAQRPETRIYVLSSKPSIRRWSDWPKMQEANRLIVQECATDPKLTYVNVADKMLNSDGHVKTDIFEKDNLHMNRKGYLIWRDVLKPILIEKELPFEK